ncbi:hypothetical protein EV356DRAFT_496035 [Viridothelium virens]|uniref:Uncharacterized protein n=1 Tax=Viridothelium virens TaxID=1048519 RepID=A0A6A6HRS9_VIRVR|nr:hypothetical protein EV356DRAFT_496035 [Viridothelium virens]
MASLLSWSEHGAVLVAWRNPNIARRLGGREQDIIEIGTLRECEAVTPAKNNPRDIPQEGAVHLGKAFDCIPLAIIQAVA